MHYFILAFLLLGFSSYAQPTISKQVIGTSGATFENGNNKQSYTAGEVVVGAMSDEEGSLQLGNGYYPSLDLSTLNTESPDFNYKKSLSKPNHRGYLHHPPHRAVLLQ